MAKAGTKDKADDEAVAVEPEKDGKSEAGSDAVAAPEATDRPAPRRAPGQKEVIPFAWKICGYSFDGHTLTLFKSVELADAEAQLIRLENEGYYDGLKLYAVDDSVPESPVAKKLRTAAAKKKGRKGKRAGMDESEPVSALRKAAKTPAVIKTAMGTVVDGRITARKKKSARAAEEKAAAAGKSRSRRSSERRTTTGKGAASKSARKSAKSPGAKSATQKKRSGKTASKKTGSKKTGSKKTGSRKSGSKKTGTKRSAPKKASSKKKPSKGARKTKSPSPAKTRKSGKKTPAKSGSATGKKTTSSSRKTRTKGR